MRNHNSRSQLIDLLREFGVGVVEGSSAENPVGFPLEICLSDGESVLLNLSEPGLFVGLDQDEIGVVVIDQLGYTRKVWGLAKKLPYFRPNVSVLATPVAGIMDAGAHLGHGALYLDGYRYYSTAEISKGTSDIFVLVVNANDERKARRQATREWLVATTLRRLGKALTMNQTTHQICVAAVHELASATDLAAALVWIRDPELGHLVLAASVGVNRQGTQSLSALSATGDTCLAELVAKERQAVFVPNVALHSMSVELEAKCCYLKPGGLSVHPLVISDRLVGVLELIGKEDDVQFEENQDLFQTVAEHLALALNSAALYEFAERRASHDALTGIANHRSLQEFLNIRLNEAERTDRPLGVVMVDVDHFRNFNEEEGHDAGDQVLRLVADGLRSAVRPYDLAARYGGEEFALVLPGANLKETMIQAERVRQRIEATEYVNAAGQTRNVTISLGCAAYPESGALAPELLKAADTALYAAKRAGRNCAKAYESKKDSSAEREGFDIEKALARLRAEDKKEGEALLTRVQSKLELLCKKLKLSPTQRLLLHALVLVAPGYRKAEQEGGLEAIRSLESHDEFRLLTPGLQGMDERFDGSGPRGWKGTKIPLLSRAVAALLAASGRMILPDIHEEGAYDPEIVAILDDRKRAA